MQFFTGPITINPAPEPSKRSRWRWVERASWIAAIVVCLTALHPASTTGPEIRSLTPRPSCELLLPSTALDQHVIRVELQAAVKACKLSTSRVPAVATFHDLLVLVEP